MGRGGVWRDLEVSRHLLNYPQVKIGDWKICVQEIIRDGCAVQTSQQRVKKKWERTQRKGWQWSGEPCPLSRHFIMRTIRRGEKLRASHTEQRIHLLLARVRTYSWLPPFTSVHLLSHSLLCFMYFRIADDSFSLAYH